MIFLNLPLFVLGLMGVAACFISLHYIAFVGRYHTYVPAQVHLGTYDSLHPCVPRGGHVPHLYVIHHSVTLTANARETENNDG